MTNKIKNLALSRIDESEEFVTKRKLMGIKQVDLAADFGIKQCTLSKMETGREKLGWRLEEMRKRYDEWKFIEIERLNKQIKYLRNL